MATKSGSKASAKSGQGKSGRLGKWRVARVGDTELSVKLPKGMVVTGKVVTIDDLLSAIATTNALDKGRVVVKCCSGNMAIA
jgi:hypothetical protein